MINFFRKIRQKLLSENKLTRYIVYAFGEIILVVIGILIALQINNWNEFRKERKLESQYYCRLLEDVKQDLKNYHNSLDLLNDKINSNNVLIQRLLDDSMPLDSIAPFILKSIKYSIRGTSATTDAFEDIKSSGNLNIIKDLSIKSKLTTYYKTLENTSTVIESNGKAITDKRFFERKDLMNAGWIKLLEELNGLDTTKVKLESLKSKVNFTNAMRKSMLNDAIFYLGNNSRNRQLLTRIEDEIVVMLKLLESKCLHQND